MVQVLFEPREILLNLSSLRVCRDYLFSAFMKQERASSRARCEGIKVAWKKEDALLLSLTAAAFD